MRLASVQGRATVLTGDDPSDDATPLHGVDVDRASGGVFGPDVQALYARWDEFRAWATGADLTAGDGVEIDLATLDNPAPDPSQVFAIGLNYQDHAAESGMLSERGVVPPTFTKYPSSLTAPFAPLHLPSDRVDWEVELVVVIGPTARKVAPADAWSHVAGLAIGQDYSERAVQSAGPVPQFSLGKSFPGFGPVGPWLVTPDELPDPTDLELTCEINGEQVQKGRTSDLVWSVAELVAVLSGICVLRPGDVIFTGTPGGVGAARVPPRFLAAGDVVVSRIAGLGEMTQTCRTDS